MLERRTKATFYAIASPLMRLNGLIYRTFRAPRGERLLVHLGPGQGNYLDGWVNVDANIFTGRCDLWADLRHPLPFHDSTVSAFYSHHVVEHLPQIETHLREVHRCLRPGGVYRLGGPHGDSAMRKYLVNDLSWFSDFPDRRQSIGGRLDNFILCRHEHLAILTPSYLRELLAAVGFDEALSCLSRQTHFPAFFAPCLAKEEVETDSEYPHTLIIEARKAEVVA